MAILNLKKKNEEKRTELGENSKRAAKKMVAVVEKNGSGTGLPASAADFASNRALLSILRPRITEKASLLMERGCYTLDVLPGATKGEIARAVRARYGVTPVRVAVASIQPKQKRMRGKRGMKPGGKKAFIYLKQGDKIELM